MNNKILVVYLFREGDGTEEKNRFITSYKNHPSGIEHDFRLILKGFGLSDSLPNIGRDLFSYWLICRQYKQYDYFVFFNSHTQIVTDNWLVKMFRFSAHGLVGTSQSLESFYTNALSRQPSSKLNWLRRLLYDEYPNRHIRTNGFLISRSIMLKIWPCYLLTKQLCYLFESGKWNLTKRVEKLGYYPMSLKDIIKDNMIVSNRNVL